MFVFEKTGKTGVPGEKPFGANSKLNPYKNKNQCVIKDVNIVHRGVR